ncbi:MAG: autoinducer binding domain-containing protein [Rhodobacteraceae bacterium]|nr:autoinducer binding domain-containing protein [Paracoccaceae bacterium]
MTKKSKNILDYLHFATHAPNLEELWAEHTSFMAGYGFDRLIYGCTMFKTQTSLGDPDDFVILTNHDPAYVHEFMDGGLFLHAPMTTWAARSEGAASWRKIREVMADVPATPDLIRLNDVNQRMGVLQGYTISFKSVSSRIKALISLCGEAQMSAEEVDAVWREHGYDLILVNNVVHLKILSLPYAPPNRSLTKRQREALQWVSDGKTTQDIAMLMGLTAATVEKHLRLARDSLSVETTAQAVMKASLHNQMYILET